MAERRKPRPDVVPRIWTEEQVAWRLGMSVETMRRRSQELKRQGMPEADPLFLGRWDIKAIEHWLDMRAGLVDAANINQPSEFERALQNGEI
ncbi:hypothetical protein [Inquilinus limosus]|uniref:Uncharacterized protein n=1 Tax=Inquilinus limosus MP06 TaxID=1398085 RepID=A0A0A0D9X1_9PROT|nr:hypothetical protein [Inquilinus limosus]KGM34683.1 hypothetical protein P409_08770 [Inquilinus limosus MP06]